MQGLKGSGWGPNSKQKPVGFVGSGKTATNQSGCASSKGHLSVFHCLWLWDESVQNSSRPADLCPIDTVTARATDSEVMDPCILPGLFASNRSCSGCWWVLLINSKRNRTYQIGFVSLCKITESHKLCHRGLGEFDCCSPFHYSVVIEDIHVIFQE